MALQKPEQSPNQYETFSESVNHLLKERGWNAAFLAKESSLSKTTVSRILRDTNNKGSTYQPTASVVTAISLAFKLDRAGWEKLMLAAFPQVRIWNKGIKEQLSVYEVNDLLYDEGLPMLTNANDG